MPMPDAMTAALQRAAAEEAEVQWGEPISAEDLALPLESASRTTEDRIWLQPACADDCERCWADHDFGPCEDCGLPCVAYVRAEAAERQIADANAHVAALTAALETRRSACHEESERAEVAERQLEEEEGRSADWQEAYKKAVARAENAEADRNDIAAQIEEWGAEKEAACMRAEVAERQLAEARKPEDYWRQVAEATELTKRDMEQSIAILIEYRARLEQELAEALGQLGAEHAAHLATGKWLADTEQRLEEMLAALTEARSALTNIARECSTFPIKNGLAFRCESLARTALPDRPAKDA